MRHGIDWDPELGVPAFLCVRGRRQAACAVCGQPGDRLCDGLTQRLAFGVDPRTCDASLCQGCAIVGAGGTDLCPACAASAANRAVAP